MGRWLALIVALLASHAAVAQGPAAQPVESQPIEGAWEAMTSPGSTAGIVDEGKTKRLDFTFAAPLGWAGAIVLAAPGAWGEAPGPGLDLHSAERLSFRARGADGGERVRVRAAVAGDQPYGDSAVLPLDSGWLTLSREWQTYALPTAGRNLSRVVTPFVLIANRQHNPAGRATVYLDSLRYDTLVVRDHVDLPPGQPAFIRYIVDPRAALVAYVPSGFDPRQPPGAAGDLAPGITADLAALRPAFDGLVLYATRPDVTPAILEAAAGGWRAVLLGIWDPKSDTEIDGVGELIGRYHGRLALAVAIGNEGINDNRYTMADLERAAAQLKARLPAGIEIPVTTSEPAADYGWGALWRFGDFLAPNVHPALDRPGFTPLSAAAWVHRRAIDLARIAGKPVLIKETGWPNGGGEAFSPDSQAQFWRDYISDRRIVWVDEPPVWVSFATAFEAFDAPWKADALNAAIEGRWGLLDSQRRPYPAFAVWREAAERR